MIAIRAEQPGAPPEHGHFWCSEAPLDDVGRQAAALARDFERTGLWPLVWMWDEDPEAYYSEPPELEQLGAFSAEEVLRTGWVAVDTERSLGPFPGLAAPAGGRVPAQPVRDPFPTLRSRARLLQVPCGRPADAIAALGWDFSFIPLAITAAVLRSWEDRFGAVPIAVEPSSILLAVDAPVTDPAQATALAAEIIAVTDTVDLREEYPSGWSEVADCLLGRDTVIHHAPPIELTPARWRLAFSEDPGAFEALAATLPV